MRATTLQQAYLDFQAALSSNPVGAEAQALYMRLLYYANLARYKQSGGEWVFKRWVEVTSKDLIRDLSMGRNAVRKIRDELVTAGYIKFKAGNGAGKTEYNLCLLFDGKLVKDPEPCEATTTKKPQKGSFDTDEFWNAAVRKSLGDDL